jgi:hypothetical protein
MTATLCASRADFPEERVSYSVLKELENSPAHALYRKTHPKEQTPAMIFGSAVDLLLSDDPDGQLGYHPKGESSRTNAFKKAKAEFEGEVYIDFDTFTEVQSCVAAIKNSALWQGYIQRNRLIYQQAGWFEEEVGQGTLVIACVMDFLDKTRAITDLKVTQEITPRLFRQQVLRMGWDVQAATYRRLMRDVGYDLPVQFLAVASKPPYASALYVMPEEWLDVAERKLIRWIQEWGYWKDYEYTDSFALTHHSDPLELETPGWLNE